MPRRTPARLLLVVGALAALTAACSSDDDTGTASPTTAATSTDTGADDTGSDDTTGDGEESEAATSSGADEDPTTAPPPTEPEAPVHSGLYDDLAVWLCHPELAENPCETDLDVTVVAPDGTTEVVEHVLADNPPYDCFYVYPTINLTGGGNAPFDDEYGPELGITRTQAARFSSLCEVYAPVHRQVTLDGFMLPEAADFVEVAYADVLDAWRYYLAEHNDGRGVVLMGHSQGTGHLTRLVAEEIDDDEAVRARLISALLIGSDVEVPEGEDVGGSFDHVPGCTTPDQTGCVVSFASYRDTAPPPPNAFFGVTRSGSGQALCTNPAALGGGSAPLEMITTNSGEFFEPAALPPPGAGGPIETPYVALPDLIEGECVEIDGNHHLQIRLLPPDPGVRVDDFTGDLTPEWGLHAIDYNLVMGNLVELVSTQGGAWLEANA